MVSWQPQASKPSQRWLTLVILLVCLSGLCVLGGKHSRKEGSRTEHTRKHLRVDPAKEKKVKFEQTTEHLQEDPAKERGSTIAQIREHLLQQLGIAEVPTAAEEFVEEVSEEIKEEYRILVEAQSREPEVGSTEHGNLGAQRVSSFRGDIVEVHSKGDWLPGKGLLCRHYRLTFNFSLPSTQSLATLQLVLHQQPVNKGRHKEWLGVQQTMEIEKVVRTNNTTLKTPLVTKMLTFGPGGFRLVDLTLDGGSWLHDYVQPDGDGYVELEATVYFAGYVLEEDEETHHSRVDQLIAPSITFDTGADDPSQAPRLVLMTLPHSAVVKKKRDATGVLTVHDIMRQKYCSGNNVYCCLHNITINFAEDLYWNFVDRPKEAVFGYCSGPCPSGNTRLGTPDVYTAISSVMPSVKPCCTGRSYHPFTILTTWKSFPIITFQRAKVVDCHCR